MRLNGTREEYLDAAQEAKEIYLAAKEKLNVKLKPYEAEIAEIDQKIARAKEEQNAIEFKRSHRKIGYLSLALFIVDMFTGSLSLGLQIAVAAAAIGSLIAFFVVRSKNKKTFENASYMYDAQINKLIEDKLRYGSDDPEVVALRETMAKAESDFADYNECADEAYVHDALGGNGIVVSIEGKAVIHYKSSVGGLNIAPMTKNTGIGAVVKVDGSPRGDATGAPLFIPVSGGVHNLAIEYQFPASFNFFDEVYTMPNNGYIETRGASLRLENDVQYLVVRNINFKKGVDADVQSPTTYKEFCRMTGMSEDEFLSYIS